MPRGSVASVSATRLHTIFHLFDSYCKRSTIRPIRIRTEKSNFQQFFVICRQLIRIATYTLPLTPSVETGTVRIVIHLPTPPETSLQCVRVCGRTRTIRPLAVDVRSPKPPIYSSCNLQRCPTDLPLPTNTDPPCRRARLGQHRPPRAAASPLLLNTLRYKSVRRKGQSDKTVAPAPRNKLV